MSRFKLPPQIIRIILLTVFIVGSYLVARAILTPKSFGKYGHYRADALQEVASKSPVYAGQKSCDECHSDVLQHTAKFEHKGVSCESCHGASLAHVDNPDITTTKLDDKFCLRCHESLAGRPSGVIKQIVYDKHYLGEACKECHMPHQPNEVP